MNENDRPDENEQKPGDRVLGVIPGGPRDSTLEEAGMNTRATSDAPERVEPAVQAQSKPGVGSHRRKGAQGAPVPAEVGKLALPRGGLVAMRKSGGLKFSTQQVVVYKDGRAVSDTSRGAGGKARKLSDAQLAELYRTLDGIDFSRLEPTIGRQNPDAFAYEIAVRIGRTLYNVEVFDGSIPEEIEPLIRLLRQFA
jgi:hypothetical protein